MNAPAMRSGRFLARAKPRPLRVPPSPRSAGRPMARRRTKNPWRRGLMRLAFSCCRAPPAAELEPLRHSRPRQDGAPRSFCPAGWPNPMAAHQSRTSCGSKRRRPLRSRPSQSIAQPRARSNMHRCPRHALSPRPLQPLPRLAVVAAGPEKAQIRHPLPFQKGLTRLLRQGQRGRLRDIRVHQTAVK